MNAVERNALMRLYKHGWKVASVTEHLMMLEHARLMSNGKWYFRFIFLHTDGRITR